MITPQFDHGAQLLRAEFSVDEGHGEVLSARWLVTAKGVFEAYLGGAPVSDDVLSPGWSSYEWRLRYRVYDVTRALSAASGPVVLGLALGNGWSRGQLTWQCVPRMYGDELGALAQLEIRFTDGHSQTVLTDQTWTAGPSAVVENDLYDGQTIEARLTTQAWLMPGFTHPDWSAVRILNFDTATLVPYLGPPVIRHEEIRPSKVWRSAAGNTLIDFGQNLVGWLRFTVQGEAGSTITIRHAEVLEQGELGTRPLRNAKAVDRLILSGGVDSFEPTFTFHGFRYAEVDGWPGELSADSLVAVVVSSDLRRIGEFECSDDDVNQLHRNVVWSLRGNFLDIPMDCPQRDERLGWTGDLAVFAPTAAFLYDVNGFLQDWLADLAAEQTAADGRVPFVIPDALKYMERPPGYEPPPATAIWSDAAVWVPWALWQAYGDRAGLAAAYPAMIAYLRRAETLLSPNGLWDTGFQFGDWLDPVAPPDRPGEGRADKGVVATACLYRSAVTVSEAARILGHTEDAVHIATLAERIRTAFHEHYVTEGGRVHSDCATVYSLAIVFGLLDEAEVTTAGDRLVELVVENGYRIATGFAGTPYICDALSSTDHLDVAYRILLERQCPSWLYTVSMGATTIWERWDSMLPDGSINPGEMTSFNHYALGAVADWMHRVIGGITAIEPGYARVRIAPQPGGGITWAATSLETPHGRVAVRWDLNDSGLRVGIDVPESIEADLVLPGLDPEVLGSGHHTRSVAARGVNSGRWMAIDR
jgi:alpha-L-rhamnosidase